MQSLSRRDFLRLLGMAAGVALVQPTAAAAPCPRLALPGIHRTASRSLPYLSLAAPLSRSGCLPPF